MTIVIKVEKLSKKFGKFTALSEIDFSVSQGEVHGLLGANGAGKTTTMRCLLGLTNATSGDMFLMGEKIQKNNHIQRREISYLSGDFRSHENMRSIDYFKYLLRLENSKSKRYEELSSRFDLDFNRKIADLSKGNKQKVGIVQAFMKSPKILILDEPTGGLDPNLQREFRKLLEEEKNSGSTILLSSHDLLEIQNTCDHVTIIKEGSVIASLSKEELNRKSLSKITVRFVESPKIQEIKKNKSIKNYIKNENEFIFYISGSMNDFVQFLSKYKIEQLYSDTSDLNETLLEYF
jgi:ABC-2 type transport system ATP-binding protein